MGLQGFSSTCPALRGNVNKNVGLSVLGGIVMLPCTSPSCTTAKERLAVWQVLSATLSFRRTAWYFWRPLVVLYGNMPRRSSHVIAVHS